MASILFKWLVPFFLLVNGESGKHPIYVSVVEIEHNVKDKTLEVSCKIFTDDLEKALRSIYKKHIDIADEKIKADMLSLIKDYVNHHLQIQVNGTSQPMKALGFEIIEEAVYSYYEIERVPEVKSISLKDDILYEYKSEQMAIIHITVNNTRKSSRLVNPDKDLTITF